MSRSQTVSHTLPHNLSDDVRSTQRSVGRSAGDRSPVGPNFTVRRDEDRAVVRIGGPLAHELARPIGLAHVRRLSDDTGVLEHAEGAIGRREHGYCTDDVARQLLVACLFPLDPSSQATAEQGLAFLRHAAMPEGRFRSRMNYARIWIDDGDSDDASGRALWALGVAVESAPWPHVHEAAARLFAQMSGFRSGHWHANAFAALGAGSALAGTLQVNGAGDLARRLADSLPRARTTGLGQRGSGDGPATWIWPEGRVTYASAVLPDALLSLSTVNEALVDDGLTLLRWLAERVIVDGVFSPVPVHGLGSGDVRPGFDQQPIEAQAFACAAWRAWSLTLDVFWLEMLVRTAAWFVGANDVGSPMIDRSTDGGFDGLTRHGPNINQGAESTLAMLHTMAVLRTAVDRGLVVVDDPTSTRTWGN